MIKGGLGLELHRKYFRNWGETILATVNRLGAERMVSWIEVGRFSPVSSV
jgi:hypothetical protein